MIASWFGGRVQRRDVITDADALHSALGDHAYELARTRAREAREAYWHWHAVRRELGRREGRSFLDTATRMLAGRK